MYFLAAYEIVNLPFNIVIFDKFDTIVLILRAHEKSVLRVSLLHSLSNSK